MLKNNRKVWTHLKLITKNLFEHFFRGNILINVIARQTMRTVINYEKKKKQKSIVTFYFEANVSP